MKIIKLTLLLVAASFILSCGGQKDTIKVGLILPLTGDAASWGIPPKNGAIIAAEEINNNGGINGKKIELIIEDSQCDPQKSITAINKLLNIDKPIAIIGDVCSSATLAIAPIAEKNRIVLISPASTNPKITDAGDFIFRDIPSDELRGKIFAKYIYDSGIKRIAILYINNDGGKGNEISFTKYFAEYGGKVILSESYATDIKDLKTQLTKLNNVKPDAILSISQVTDATITLVNSKELNIKLPLFFQTEALDDPSVIKNAGDATDGAIYVSFAKINNNKSKTFLETYKKKYGKEPELFAAESYDAVMLIADILKNNVDGNSESIKDALYEIKNYEGASGTFTFDKNGDVIKPLAIKKIINNNITNIGQY